MKKTIIIILIVLFLGTGLVFLIKKISGATKMTFDAAGVNLGIANAADVLKLIASGRSGYVDVLISNFSNENYSLDNVYVELYALDGTLVAYQTEPMTQKIEIKPNTNNIVRIPMYIKGALVAKLGQQIGGQNVLQAGKDALTNYFTTGKIGTALKVKGFATKGIAKIPFKFDKNI
jgi:hypothetical protein